MPANIHLKDVPALVGTELGVSRWFTVDQTMIDRFADATEDHPSSGLSQTMGILGVILAVVTLATFFVAHGAWWVIPFVLTGLTAVTAWNSALRAQGEISLGAPYRWNSRIQLGYTLGRIVGYLFIAVIAALLIYAIVLMLAGQLKL